MSDETAGAPPGSGRPRSPVPPLSRHLTPPPGDRPPTAMLPPGAREASQRRAVSPVPPTRSASQDRSSRLGVAAALVPEEAMRPRRSRQDLLRNAVVVARILSLLAGLAVTPLLQERPRLLPWLFLAAFVLTVVRSVRPATTVVDQVVDVLFVSVILMLSDGMLGPFALFGAATAFSIGASAGIPGGLAGAAALVFSGALIGLGTPMPSARREEISTVIGWISLYPVGAVLGGLVGHVMVENRAGQAMLIEANRVLATLERLAVAAPETLSPGRVANAAAAQFRQVMDGDVAFILFEREGSLIELGRDETIDAGSHLVLDDDWQPLVRSGSPRHLADSALPPRVLRQLPALPGWVVVPLRARDRRIGIALIGGARYPETRATRTTLQDLGAETAVALDNTQLFSRVEQAAAAAERERLASDLHDGVAQQLTHVRFELELLSRASVDETTRTELDRLARVAQRATDDVRSAIRGLRAQALHDGLVPALRSLVADLDGASGPTLELAVNGAAELDPETTAEVYRIVQEALSNALRHARASTITVAMDVIADTLLLSVEDDGRGLGGVGAGDGDGMGLRTMRSRARRIGADFSVDDGEDGGARVELRIPLGEELAR